MKPYRKEKMTFQQFVGGKFWKQFKTYLKNRGRNVSKKTAIKLV